MEVFNHDVVGLHARLNRFLTELQKSASSNTAVVSIFDADRLQSYMSAVHRYHDWVVAQPQLDLPESAPRKWVLEENTELVDTENESVNDVCRMLDICRFELTNSQSARMPSGLLSFDSARLIATVVKCEKFLADYIRPTTPLDLPESTPREMDTGSGQLGVNPGA